MHWVKGKLKDVAKGTITQPLSCNFHNNPMGSDFFRVRYDLVLPGYEELEPPSQPEGWDSDVPAVLCTGFGYLYQWPKSQICLGTEGRGTTPPQPA